LYRTCSYIYIPDRDVTCALHMQFQCDFPQLTLGVEPTQSDSHTSAATVAERTSHEVLMWLHGWSYIYNHCKERATYATLFSVCPSSAPTSLLSLRRTGSSGMLVTTHLNPVTRMFLSFYAYIKDALKNAKES
jgi:hypothetical protein